MLQARETMPTDTVYDSVSMTFCQPRPHEGVSGVARSAKIHHWNVFNTSCLFTQEGTCQNAATDCFLLRYVVGRRLIFHVLR